jgi:hypothetical protein
MKHPIAWHQQNVKNMKSSLPRMREEIEEKRRALSHLETEIGYREIQIDNAIKLGKPDFDEERFCPRAKVNPQ